MEGQIDYKQKYKVLKKKLKFLVYEQECFLEELRKAQRRLLKVSRDRSFLLDRLLQYEKLEESSGDSDLTASSDSEPESLRPEGSTSKRKRGALPAGFDPSAVLGGMGFTAISQGPPKKKAKTNVKKKTASKKQTPTNPMSRAELERHLESKQEIFGIEKTPAFLPSEIFSNDNSNLDSDAMMDIKDEDDDDLIIDAPQ
ncbi:INO80 complex subunit E-like [Ruditapes philippinarum]|uniref:INO80 complex subunit E-like n=1 Tax=Ruditapes philippinarum TaxID=129788 RepID=UPI00295B13DE|nr:INO80 complex subunit E-like [Ruditapes philippinarum]